MKKDLFYTYEQTENGFHLEVTPLWALSIKIILWLWFILWIVVAVWAVDKLVTMCK